MEASGTRRRRRPAKQAEPEAPEGAEEEGAEDEDEPKRPGRKSAVKSKLSDEEVYDMREEGAKWTEIVEAAGVPMSSGIAMRHAYFRHAVKIGKLDPLDIEDAESIVAARDEDGEGWNKIAIRADSSVAEVQAVYNENGGEHPTDEEGGRPYGKKGSLTHRSREDLNAAKAAADEDEDEEGEDEEAEEEEAEEAPAPRRRRRAAK